MGLATVGAAEASPFDLRPSFGRKLTKREVLKWQAPAVVTANVPKAPTLDQLIPIWAFARRLVLEPVKESESHERSDESKISLHSAPTCEEQFEDRVRSARTLSQLHELRESERAALDPVEFSQVAFQALLTNRFPFEQICAFIQDPRLNEVESRNLTALVNHYSFHTLPFSDRKGFIAIIALSIFTGHIRSSDLYEILEGMGRVKLEVPSAALDGRPLDHNGFLNYAYQEMGKAIVRRQITPDLSDALRILVIKWEALGAGIGSESRRALRLKFYQYAWPVQNHDGSDPPTMHQSLAFWVGLVYSHDKVLSSDPLSTAPNLDRQTLETLIDSLRKEECGVQAASTTAFLREKSGQRDDQEAWRGKLFLWLSCLQASQRFNDQFDEATLHYTDQVPQWQALYHTGPNWHLIYKALAVGTRLVDLIPHFSTLQPLDACRIFIRFWIPRYYAPCLELWGTESNRKGRFLPTQELRETFEKLNSLPATTKAAKPTLMHFANLLAALARVKLPYRELLTDVLEFVRLVHGPEGLLVVCNALKTYKVDIFPQPILKVIRELEIENPRLAYAFYKCHKTYISNSPQLLISLIKEGLHSGSIFEILNDRDPTNTVPVAQRVHPANPLSDARNKLIHMAADTMSRYSPRSVRITFRDVYLCYRYLVDRNSPVHPLMGRALVRSGITNALQNLELVSTKRQRWILDIVRRLEGDAVAGQLDTVLFRWQERVLAYQMERSQVCRKHAERVTDKWDRLVLKNVKEDERRPIVPWRRSGVAVARRRAHRPIFERSAMRAHPSLDSSVSDIPIMAPRGRFVYVPHEVPEYLNDELKSPCDSTSRVIENEDSDALSEIEKALSGRP